MSDVGLYIIESGQRAESLVVPLFMTVVAFFLCDLWANIYEKPPFFFTIITEW